MQSSKIIFFSYPMVSSQKRIRESLRGVHFPHDLITKVTLPHLKEAKSSSKLFYILFIYWLRWTLVALCRLSPVVVTGGYSPVAAHGLLIAVASLVEGSGSRYSDYSSCSMQVQQSWLKVLVALWHVESSRTRDQTCVPCTGGRILIHCITKEILKIILNPLVSQDLWVFYFICVLQVKLYKDET